MNPSEFLDFNGRSASEAEDFICAVNRAAWTAGQHQSSTWKAEFASTAFSGKALRWYRHQSPDVQKDWSALQGALLDHFQDDENSLNAPPTNGSMPTPAAAPEAPVNHRPVATVKEAMELLSQATTTGRIMVVKGSGQSYLSRHLTENGLLQPTQNVADALVVRVSMKSNPGTIEIMTSGFNHHLLGGASYSSEPAYMALGRNTSGYMGIMACTSAGSSPPTTSWKLYVDGQIESSIWLIMANGSIVSQVTQGGVFYRMVIVQTPNGGLVMTSDLKTFLKVFGEKLLSPPVVELKLVPEEDVM